MDAKELERQVREYLPKEAVVKLDPSVTVGGISFLDISYNGEHLVIQTLPDGQFGLSVVDEDTGFTHQADASSEHICRRYSSTSQDW